LRELLCTNVVFRSTPMLGPSILVRLPFQVPFLAKVCEGTFKDAVCDNDAQDRREKGGPAKHVDAPRAEKSDCYLATLGVLVKRLACE
jgi:hypothetical protein